MRLRIERSALLKSLAHVQNVVERRTTVPILANVKLDAADGELALTATDLDVALTTSEPAEVERPGATTVPAQLFSELVRKLPEGAELLLERAGGDAPLRVEAGRFHGELPTLPAEEFPVFGEEAFDVAFTIPAADLLRLFDKVRFAISTEETRYYLNGVHLHPLVEGATSVLRGVATDGHRLARVEVPLPEGAAAMPGIIVPRKTVGEVLKLVAESADGVEVAVSTSRIRFAVARRTLVSRLIDGQFPDYERVIPKNNDRIARLETRSFAEAVDRVSTISTERFRAVKLRFEGSTAVVSAVSPETGRAYEELDVEYEGSPLEIGFNARYILDILGEIEGERLRMEMTSPAAPALLRDPADPGLLFVLMPMRV
ncbi:DNA polymerase III subunit beta [bacterium HR39]|nr:DNA polymerase III subunit beta [bacterium HR39]